MKSPASWSCASFTVNLERPIIMGIVNVTPDSFSDGGEHDEAFAAIEYAHQLLAQGASIIDIGGESTRPGSCELAPCEELSRVLPVVSALAQEGVLVSIDTRHAHVARACVEAGAAIINDISGFENAEMLELAAACNAGLVVMHMQGEPQTMQDAPHYEDVVSEVGAYLLRQAALLEQKGVQSSRICLDPGFGFGKTYEQNLALLEHFETFASSGYPTLIAVSRKGFIGRLFPSREGDIADPAKRNWGSVAVAVQAVQRGARLARVHDVCETREAFDYLESTPARVFVAIGSNEGDKCAQVQNAIEAIGSLPATRLVTQSSLYLSEPAYYSEQDCFANAVIELETGLCPQVLLTFLQQLEVRAGRQKSFRNAPRPLDLDILDYEHVVLASERLSLPHPKLLERDFVVTPLLEIAPSCQLADGVTVTREQVSVGKCV